MADHRTSATAPRILLAAVILGVLADVTLRNAPFGLGWTLWVTALAVAAVIAPRGGLGVEELGWLGVAVGCAAGFAWRDAEALRGANVLGTLVALGLFAMAAARLPAVSILAARLRDVVAAGVYAIRDVVIGAGELALRDAEVLSLPALRGRAGTAIRVVLLTVPVAVVFAVLLSRADPVFASLFNVDLEQLFSHVLLTGVFAWGSAGWLRGGLPGVAWRPVLPERLPIGLGLAEVTAVLGTVSALFAVFVGLQLRWLFGGAEVVLATTGLTVAEYARRGFFELVGVAALVLPLILVTRAIIEDERVLRRHRVLSLGLILLLAAIVASAVLRMKLYIEYYGLTTDRLYATAIMGWLGVVFGAMAITVLRGGQAVGRSGGRSFAAVMVLSAFLTLVTLNVLNPERMVARVNLERSNVRQVDYGYLVRLSGDAMPLVVNALKTAPASSQACTAATWLRDHWMKRQETDWNWGARRGREVVMGFDVGRLC